MLEFGKDRIRGQLASDSYAAIVPIGLFLNITSFIGC